MPSFRAMYGLPFLQAFLTADALSFGLLGRFMGLRLVGDRYVIVWPRSAGRAVRAGRAGRAGSGGAGSSGPGAGWKATFRTPQPVNGSGSSTGRGGSSGGVGSAGSVSGFAARQYTYKLVLRRFEFVLFVVFMVNLCAWPIVLVGPQNVMFPLITWQIDWLTSVLAASAAGTQLRLVSAFLAALALMIAASILLAIVLASVSRAAYLGVSRDRHAFPSALPLILQRSVPYVMISYTWSHSGATHVARSLASVLPDAWLDACSMAPGSHVSSATAAFTKASFAFVACLSPVYLRRHACAVELVEALLHRKPDSQVSLVYAPEYSDEASVGKARRDAEEAAALLTEAKAKYGGSIRAVTGTAAVGTGSGGGSGAASTAASAAGVVVPRENPLRTASHAATAAGAAAVAIGGGASGGTLAGSGSLRSPHAIKPHPELLAAQAKAIAAAELAADARAIFVAVRALRKVPGVAVLTTPKELLDALARHVYRCEGGADDVRRLLRWYSGHAAPLASIPRDLCLPPPRVFTRQSPFSLCGRPVAPAGAISVGGRYITRDGLAIGSCWSISIEHVALLAVAALAAALLGLVSASHIYERPLSLPTLGGMTAFFIAIMVFLLATALPLRVGTDARNLHSPLLTPLNIAAFAADTNGVAAARALSGPRAAAASSFYGSAGRAMQGGQDGSPGTAPRLAALAAGAPGAGLSIAFVSSDTSPLDLHVESRVATLSLFLEEEVGMPVTRAYIKDVDWAHEVAAPGARIYVFVLTDEAAALLWLQRVRFLVPPQQTVLVAAPGLFGVEGEGASLGDFLLIVLGRDEDNGIAKDAPYDGFASAVIDACAARVGAALLCLGAGSAAAFQQRAAHYSRHVS